MHSLNSLLVNQNSTTRSIGSLAELNVTQAAAIANETRRVTHQQAGGLQVAAAQSLHGINEITTRFTKSRSFMKLPYQSRSSPPFIERRHRSILGRPVQPATYAGVISFAGLFK